MAFYDEMAVADAAPKYLKFQKGDNLFRVAGQGISGHEYFNNDNKPVRARERFQGTPIDIKVDGQIKGFWAFPVFNYETETLQILEITQTTIMRAMKEFGEDRDYGDPLGYDLRVKRTGDGMDTKYTVTPKPPSKPTKAVVDAMEQAKTVNLNALFDGGDPFAGASDDMPF